MTLDTQLLSYTAMTPVERAQGRFMRAPDGHPAGGAFDDAFSAAIASDGEIPAVQDTVAGGEAQDTVAGGEAQDTVAGGEAQDTVAGGEAQDTVAGGGAQDTVAGGEAKDEPKASLSAEEVLNRLAGMIPQPAAPQGAGEQPASGGDTQAPLYNTDEMAVLTDYEKNWPDVSRAEQLKRRAEYHDLLKYIFTEVVNVVSPLQEQMRTVGNTLHVGELKAAVPDYSENLEQEVTTWIDTQPAYLQSAYKQVMQAGTSDEVADLIGRYRAASGAAPAAPAPVPAPAGQGGQPAPAPKAPAKTELSSTAKQAAASLAPVSGDRSAVPQGEDPQDFDSAFKRWAAAENA